MPVFAWEGMDRKGKNQKGIMDAESLRQAKNRLKEQGYFLTSISESRSGSEEKKGSFSMLRNFTFTGRVKDGDIVIMTRLLANLVRANIPIVEALTAIIDQVDKAHFKLVLSQVRDNVNEGKSLSESLGQHPKLFPNLYVNMVAAGEQSGALDVVMERLADFMESQFKLKKQVQGAMTYPILMFFFAIGVVSLLFVVVIPKMVKLFQDIKATLPLPTRILIGVSDFAASYWWLILIMIAIGIWAFRRWKQSPKGGITWDRFMLRAPILGELTLMIAVSRFSKTLATLLSSGVPLLGAMDIVKNILNNKVLVSVLEEARENIREGESIAQPLKRSKEFPPIVTHMIAIGERTGDLESMLTHVSASYDTQVEAKIGALTSVLEPVMIIFMGAVVGFIVMAIMSPILSLNQQIRM